MARSRESSEHFCDKWGLHKLIQATEVMEKKGIPISRNIVFGLLQLCTKTKDLCGAKRVQYFVYHHRLRSVTILWDYLIRLFACCGNLFEANEAFTKVKRPTIHTWSAVIAANVKFGQGEKALQLYRTMRLLNVKATKHIFLDILKACAITATLIEGKLVHNQIIQRHLGADIILGSTLVAMYAKCGSIHEAQELFNRLQSRNVVSWGAMITGYTHHGQCHTALHLYQQMSEEDIKPEKATYLSILKACTSIGALEEGRAAHNQIIQSGLESDELVRSALVNMYAKCGNLEAARNLFDKLPNQSLESWSSMIAGYAWNDCGISALELYKDMQHISIRPDRVTFLSALKACGSIGAVEHGRLMHDQIIKCGFEFDIVVGNALVDMYAKCGSLGEAHTVFDCLQNQDVISWGAIISGHARAGNVELAKQYLDTMQQRGIRPDDVTFTSILAACSHAGLLDEGHQFFMSMTADHGILANVNHYTCIIDLFGRGGRLNEAERLLYSLELDAIGWTSLLTACRTYGNVEIGRRCFDQVIGLEYHCAAAYITMANIFRDAHLWNDACEIEHLRKCACAWKKPGRAWIELNNQVHEFVVGDKSHSENDKIYSLLKELHLRMKEKGYISLLPGPMHKEDAFCGHAERLAIAFGIISTLQGATIRVTKNLRVCSDCHYASKLISNIENREIVIRDSYRIHHFKNGECSCGDYF